MSEKRKRPRALPYWSQVNKFISEFPDLKYTGTVIFCCVCQHYLHALHASDCRRHVECASHIQNSKLKYPYWKFILDLTFMFSVCGIPQWVLEKEPFRAFWKKYISEWPLPTRQQVRWQVPRAKQLLETTIQHNVRDKKIWLTVEETIDAKNHKVGNVLIRSLNPNGPSNSYLIACNWLETTNAETIQQLIIRALNKINIQHQNVLMLVSHGATYMRKVGEMLKTIYPNMLHITCLLQALHSVAEQIRTCYPNVDKLISSTQMVFIKAPQRLKKFHEACPGIPEPPKHVLTRWGTWLQAAFYYNEHFEQVKSVIFAFDPEESNSIKKCQQQFNSSQVKEDMFTIHKNYCIIVDAIDKLQSKLSLSQSLEIVDKVNLALQSLTDESGICVAKKFQDVLRENPDLEQLRHVNQYQSDDTATNSQQYFAYANITSLDVQRSFSKYTSIFTPKRRNLSQDTIEALLMMQVYADSHKDPFMNNM